MPGSLKCVNSFLVLAALLLGLAACQTPGAPRSRPDDSSPSDDDTSPDEPSPTPDEQWGLWHGVWQTNEFVFEAAPTPATLSPVMAALADGSIVVVSTSKTQTVVAGVDVYAQTLYLAHKLADGQWRPYLALDSFGWTTQNSSLAVDAAGDVNVLYSREGAPAHLTVVDNQVTRDSLETGPSPPANVSLGFDALGELHAVFGDWSLSHQVLTTGGWQVADTNDNLSFPDIVFYTRDQSDPAARLICLQYNETGVGYTLMHFVHGDAGWQGGPVMPAIDFYEAPHAVIDLTGRTNILVPSGQGLMYLVQDPDAAGGWQTEIVAGQDSEMGYQSAAIALIGDSPVAVFRDESEADGYVSFRTAGTWNTSKIAGFNGGFLGFGLAVDPSQNLHVIFAGYRETPD
jgi:hypothetical protein